MIYRLIVSFLILVVFAIENHLSPGGQKFDRDLLAYLNFSLAVIFTWSWLAFWEVRKLQKLGRFVVPILMCVAAIIHYYKLNSGGKLEAGVILDNWKSVSNTNGMGLVYKLAYERFSASNFFWSFLIFGVFYATYFEKKSKIRNWIQSHQSFALALPVVILIATSRIFPISYESYAGIYQGVSDRYFPRSSPLRDMAIKKQPTPITAEIVPQDESKPKPNIIVVFIESLSSYFIETKSESGLEFMPHFNQLISKGLYFEKHYSVSVQTARGQFAALCGKIPIYYGLESQDYQEKNFDCLPHYMNEQGYSTVFMQAYGKPDFDNKTKFYLNQGYSDVPQVAKTCDQEKNVPCWNWGIQDDEFYRRAIAKVKDYKQPYFLTLTTVTSHMPFKGMPKDLIVHYKQPKNQFENYANTLTVVDNAIPVLFEEIQKAGIADNTVVIFVGDHGFPMGQHGNYHNENYAYEENFRVPMLVVDLRKKSKLHGRVSAPTSHLNMPATILELANYSGKTKFQGVSLLRPGYEDDPVYFIQPYSGLMIGSIRWPYKYIYEVQEGREWVYNLEADPKESNSIDVSEIPADQRSLLQNDVATIIWNNTRVTQVKSE